MFEEVLLPKIGMAMQEGMIVSWSKQVGDVVEKGEPLFDMETEKVVETVESPASGILEEILYEAGDTVEAEEVVARIRVGDGDQKDASAEQPTASAATDAAPKEETETDSEEATSGLSLDSAVPLSQMRQTIGTRMLDSLQTSAQLTIYTEVDVTETVKKREKLKKELHLTYTDILIHLVAKTIERYPMLNARLEDRKIIIPDAVHIGIAVALPDGLIVPVIQGANQKSLVEIRGERERLVELARSGDYTLDDISGGTFTITNMGMYDVDHFSPILNLPEVGILGVGRIIEKPVVFHGEIQVRSMMSLSLTIDHRVVDGAPGAEFLQSLSAALTDAKF
jgi:pyruvate dehydrogenase E2 component (dihydrolipoamide acetyltransferase)